MWRLCLASMQFKLSKYIIPTTISMVLIGTYTNIDGLFIGNAAGDNGLAAINIAWPIVAFITAVGTGLGVGGSVIISSLKGEKKYKEAEKAKYTSLMLLFLAGIALTVLCLISFYPILKLMGAEGIVLKYASEYSLVISLGALFQIVGSGIVVLLRNEGKTFQSMAYTFVGLVIHILLDILLVKKFALYGVALSTVASQVVVMILGLVTFRVKKTQRWMTKKIIATSTAPFGVNFVPSLTLLFTNFFALRIGGTAAVSAYAVMSYVVYTYDYIFQGVCDGTQPILSFTNANGYEQERKRAVRTAILSLAGFAALTMSITPVVKAFLPRIFSVSAEAEVLISHGLTIYAFSYIFKALVKWMCAYSYSINNIWIANILTYVDPLVFSPACLIILPMFFGIDGIWLSLTASQILACILGLILLFSYRSHEHSLLQEVSENREFESKDINEEILNQIDDITDDE